MIYGENKRSVCIEFAFSQSYFCFWIKERKVENICFVVVVVISVLFFRIYASIFLHAETKCDRLMAGLQVLFRGFAFFCLL
jgi:hypothetical protein